MNNNYWNHWNVVRYSSVPFSSQWANHPYMSAHMAKSSLHAAVCKAFDLAGCANMWKVGCPSNFQPSSCTTLSEPVIFTFKIRISFVSPWNVCSLQVHSVVSSPGKFHQIDQYVHHQKTGALHLTSCKTRGIDSLPHIFPIGCVAILPPFRSLAAELDPLENRCLTLRIHTLP